MIPPFRTEFTDAEIATIVEHTEAVLRSGWLTLGEHTERFEQALTDMSGCQHAVAVSSGCAALECLLRALDATGRTVLVPANTNIATVTAAIHAGAHVELYDAGLEPNLADLATRLRPDVAAVVVVHIGGYISPSCDELERLCRDNEIPLVEDAAHAHGALHRGRPAGSLGRAAAFSFFPTKVATTGEGGAVTTDDADLAERVRQYRNHGTGSTGPAPVLGHSWRLPEISAVLGWVRLEPLAQDRDRLNSIAHRYAHALGKEALGEDGLDFPEVAADCRISGYKSIAWLAGRDREALRTAAAARGVQLAREVYDTPLHRHPAAAAAGLNTSERFPTAETFTASHVCLPLWRGLSDDQVDQVIDGVRAALHTLDHARVTLPGRH